MQLIIFWLGEIDVQTSRLSTALHPLAVPLKTEENTHKVILRMALVSFSVQLLTVRQKMRQLARKAHLTL